MSAGISTRTPQQALAALLDRYAPQQLLLIGASDFPALAAFKEAHPATEVAQAAPGPLPAELAARRFDLRGHPRQRIERDPQGRGRGLHGARPRTGPGGGLPGAPAQA